MQSAIWLRNAIDAVDILVVAILIYGGLLIIKGTRASPMMWGLAAVVALYFLAKALGLITLDWILGHLLGSIILVVVVIFQEEIRRGLTKVGLAWAFRKSGKGAFDKTVEDLTLVCSALAESRTGALVVIQRDVGLDEFIEDAVPLDALMNRKLLFTIFMKTSPLHDGAVIIDGDRIKAVGCVLPLSFNPDLDPSLGTRHRAALGISERSDAAVIVVSEETGAISLVRDGKMVRHLEAADLRAALLSLSARQPAAEPLTDGGER